MKGRTTAASARGFTLFELLTVLAIVATIAALAAPRYGEALARYRADATARRVVADLALTRSEARAASGSRSAIFDLGRNELRIPGALHIDRAAGEYRLDFGAAPYQARLVSANFGGLTFVVFDGYGRPSSGGAVVVRSGVSERTVVLDGESGEASVP